MKNLIGNDWKDSSNLSTIEVINPATLEVIDTIPNSTVDDVVLAMDIAKEAKREWSTTPLYERGEILVKFAKVLDEGKEDLATILSEESGKAYKESYHEIELLRDTTVSIVECARHLFGVSVLPGSEKNSEASFQFSTREALGIVGLILPFNLKIDLLAKKLISPLMMGNTIIIKPSKKVPLTITKIVYMLRLAGVYEGVVQVIHGDGKVVGQALAMHPDLDFISFTGSTANGIRVMTSASKNLTKTVLDLAGNNAFILCKDGDVDLAVDEAAYGRFYYAGQSSFSNKRFLVHSSLKEEFINKLIKRIGSIKVGLPIDKDIDLGCLIDEKSAEKVEKQVNDMIAAGAKLIIGGKRSGAFFEPTIVSNVSRDMPAASNLDILGPVVSIIEFDNLNDAVDIVNQSVYGNGTSIFTKNTKIAFKLANLIKNGMVVINGSTVHESGETVGEGWNYSGIGKNGIVSSLEEASKTKAIILKDVLK